MAAKRVRVSDERAWAMGQGFEMAPKGPLPAWVHDAWLEHQELEEGPMGPDPEDPDLADEPELEQDPEPKRIPDKKNIFKSSKRTVKVTPSVRKDIKAKVALMITLPAGLAARRDPICGTVLLEQVPQISDALVDIIADSPDLVQFFTAGGSGYMKWLNLAVALQPVATVAFQHHVAHSIGVTEDGLPEHEDYTQYAAPEFA
jgi:hypothetical protein